jgi:ABC-type nitrate/sulfonate/bicarbonate transport system substrate-binding protein
MFTQNVLAKFKHGFLILVAISLLSSHALAAEPRKVSIGYSTIGPMATGLWMAKEIGAFDRYGIQAELVYISSGPVVTQALIGGDLDAGLGATNAVISAILSGAPLMSVLSVANKAAMRLYVQPEIERVQDLRGKNVGVTRFGSVTHNLTLLLLRKHGLEGAVNVRQMGDTMAVSAAFERGAIAGAVTSFLRVGTHVPQRLLVKFEETGIPYSMDVIVFTRDYHRRYPKTVEGIVRAYIEGVAALHQDKKRALEVVAKYMRVADPRMWQIVYEDSANFLEKIPRVEPEAVLTILEFIGKKDVPLKTFVDNSIVDRLISEGFIDRLYEKR